MPERGLPSLCVQAFNMCRSEGPEGNMKALMMYRVQGPQNVHISRTIYDTSHFARKMKDKLNIATWNIRTLLQKGKLENIKQEMERMKFNILGLSEVRWKGAGKITSGGHQIIYSGGTESEKGVGIIVDQTVTKAIKGYWALSDGVLLVKIAGKPVDLNII
ncbi:craniofacial development protein 2-like [Plakobranchus ocellatus]|uniref:Craniofacial development protein 2-like n=1 Tax=Plakobranchus ocellatus TaxID=259542 RepID=A0AAV4E1S1_9GAST|nr:craniofacial development protein 2-like [Plakobranchus ocellatus]